MVYRWNHHKDTLQRLYVEEKRSMEDVVEYMREHHDFTPSRRAFQHAFSRWGFPGKQKPAYKNEQLVARVRELWERNIGQKDMLPILASEGYDLGERDVARIRSRNGWLLRSSASTYGMVKATDGTLQPQAGDDDADGDADADGEELNGDDGGDRGDIGASEQHREHEHSGDYYGFGASGLSPVDAQVQEETLNAMREARREYRKRLAEAESQEKWMAKKRRRHTKPYAGLPADPPGPPRFPSETTLTEAKEILQLDAAAYKTMRDKFQAICEEAGVYKKTLVGPERWEALKDQLVRESMHLRAVMWDPTDMEKKKLGIEVIACDVTKKIRVMASGIGVADAKVILGLNPEQGRIIRAQLYKILAQEKFTSKHEEGLEYFETLKQRWIAGSPELSSIVAAGPVDPDYPRKMKAIKALCRDATRRYRDDVYRLGKIPAGLQSPKPKPTTPKPKATPKRSAKAAGKQKDPGPVTFVHVSTPESAAASAAAAQVTEPDTPAPPSQPRRRGRPKGSKNKPKPLPHLTSRLVLANESGEPEPEDPVEAQPATNPPTAPLTGQQNPPASEPQPQQGQDQATTLAAPPPSSSGGGGAIAVFLRLNSSSTVFFPSAPRQWISTLGARTIAELRGAAVQKTPGALCYKIEGVVKDGRGGELPLPVSDQVELDTYLAHVEGQGAPTFSIHIVPGE